jgi:hypothetical protein
MVIMPTWFVLFTANQMLETEEVACVLCNDQVKQVPLHQHQVLFLWQDMFHVGLKHGVLCQNLSTNRSLNRGLELRLTRNVFLDGKSGARGV